MKGLPWFRLHSDMINDYKVLRMPENFRWRWVALLCTRCELGATLHDIDIINLLRISESDWIDTKKEFIKNELIDEDNNVLNWEKRQYISDNSSERSRIHRENKKMQRCSNVAATASDTDTETDTEFKKIYKKSFEIEKEENGALQVFDYWFRKSPGAHTDNFDGYRKKYISKMLKYFSVDDLKLAIDGCYLSPYHMGENKNNAIIDSVDIIFKNVDTVERLISIAKNPTPISTDGKQDNSKYDTLLSESKDDKVVKFVEILKSAEMQCRYNLNVEEIKMYYDALKGFCLRSISFAFSEFQKKRTPYDGKFPKVSLLLDFARIKQSKFEEDCVRIWEEVLRYIGRKWNMSDFKEGSTEHLIFNNSEFRAQFPENLEELLEDSSHRDYSKRGLYKKKFIELYLKIEGEK